jgi:phenylalanyl-tRNA synthetase beta chain
MLSHTVKPDREKVASNVSDLLSANGFAEIMCNSLAPAAWFDRSGDFDTSRMVQLANPLSIDLNVMRMSLLPGMLSTISHNINRQSPDLRLYELGYVYNSRPGKEDAGIIEAYSERQLLAMAITGDLNPKRWNAPATATGFFQIKGYVEMVLSRFGIERREIDEEEDTSGWFSEGLKYGSGGADLASFGKISKKYLEKFDIRQDVWYAELNHENIIRMISRKSIRFSELPKYPWVRRDLALVIDKSVRFSQIRDLAYKTERNILQQVDLFDVYESDAIGRDKKSYAVSFILRDDRQTLTEKSIEKVMSGLFKAFEREFGAALR